MNIIQPERTRDETREEKHERLANSRRKRQYDIINQLRKEYIPYAKDISSRELANPELNSIKIVYVPLKKKQKHEDDSSDDDDSGDENPNDEGH